MGDLKADEVPNGLSGLIWSTRFCHSNAHSFMHVCAWFICHRFVGYTVLVCMIALSRNDLRSKVVKGSEIQEVLHSNNDLRSYLRSLYDCQYSIFFEKLGEFLL